MARPERTRLYGDEPFATDRRTSTCFKSIRTEPLEKSQSEFRTVIMFGPQCCGKTHHGADIARALGCEQVIDEWAVMGLSNGFLPPLTPGALHIAVDRPNGILRVPDDVLVIPFDAALAAAIVVGAV